MLKNWKIILLTVMLALSGIIWYAIFRESRKGILTVAFLDVGQGDSIYIESPTGNQVLIDGGPGKKVLRELSRVMPFYDKSIDLIVLSHPHLDHFSGLIDVLGRYNVGAVMSSKNESETGEFKTWKRAVSNGARKKIEAQRGQIINIGGGAYLEILFPDRIIENAKPHDAMVVAKLIYGGNSFLLTGDMEKNLENYLIQIDGPKLKSKVLKVGHHGSKTSTSELFLGFVYPDLTVVSSGKGNMYGHPHNEVIERLKNFGANTWRTDQKGALIIKSDGEKFEMGD